MGQSDIIELLEKSDHPLSRSEIADVLKVQPSTISMLINKLIKYNEILFEEIDKEMALKKYGCKKRMRLYFSIDKFSNKKSNSKTKKKN